MYQLSVFVHVVAAIIWIGGMLFLALVVGPASRRLPPAERGALFSLVGRRFRTVGWICIALLLVTGVANVAFRGFGWDAVTSGQLFGSEFGRVLAVKLVVIAIMLAFSAAHDFLIGPGSAAARANPAGQRQAVIARRRASWFGRANTALALVVVALAVALVRGLPW
ncbi:MAG: DUF4149 domain-containing protein [Thermomicrobiales bacterium]|nr:DUF4149 domain-containing protein [Thermomicrobiales bacterium]